MRLRIQVAIALVMGLISVGQDTGIAQTNMRNVAVITGSGSVTQVVASTRYLAWSQTSPRRPGHGNVYVKQRGAGDRVRVNARGTEGSLGAIDGRRLVFQQFRGSVDDGSSSIKIANLATGKKRTPREVNSRHWDFWPALDGRWMLHGRTNADKGTTKVLLTNLRTGKTRTLERSRASTYLQPGQINGKYAVWMKWKSGGKGKIFIHNLETRRTKRLPDGGKWNWGPSVSRRGVVYFARSGRNCGSDVRILRWKKGRGTKRLIALPNGVDTGDSYVARNADGDTEVYYTRVVCEPNFEGDGYKLLFTRQQRPNPSPSPTSPSPSPTPEGPTLTVEIVGDGEVTSDPEGIDCESECEATFEEGEEITLTAIPDEGERVWDWSVAGCGRRDTTCTFEMPEDDVTVTVTFR